MNDPDTDTTGSERSALNGTIIWGPFEATPDPNDVDCADVEAAYKAFYTDIFANILKPRVVDAPGPMTECLKDTVLSGEDWISHADVHNDVTFPEEIMRRLRDNIPTHVACENNAGGCGSGSTPETGEFFACGPDSVATDRVGQASVALHEVSHRYYYHPGPNAEDFQESVPISVQHCLKSVEDGEVPPHSLLSRRSLFGGTETTLSQVGLEAMAPTVATTPTYCAANEYMVGFQGRRSSSFLRALGGVCRPFIGGSNRNLPTTGTQVAGTAFSSICAANEVLVGASGLVVNGINAIRGLCAATDDVRKGSSTRRLLASVGGTTGNAWERVCPPFQALKGVRMRGNTGTSGSLNNIFRLEFMCQDVRAPQTVDHVALGRAGSASTFQYYENCQSRSVALGLVMAVNEPFGSFDPHPGDEWWQEPDTVHVDRLGGWCEAAVPSAPQLGPVGTVVLGGNGMALTFEDPNWVPDSVTSHALPSHGGHFGTRTQYVDRCPPSMALVGARLYSDAQSIAGIQGECADVAGWSSGQTTSTTFTPLRGRSLPTALNRKCPARSFVVGWTIDTGPVTPSDQTTDDFIHGLNPVCRRFTGETEPLDLWSGTFSDANGWDAIARYSSIQFPNIDGVRGADVCGRGPNGIVCAISNGNAFGNATFWGTTFNDAAGWGAPQYYSTIQYPQVDGVRGADVCGRGPNGIVCGASNGTAFINANVWNYAYSDAAGWAAPQYYSTIRFPDINGDGRSDVCGRDANGILCATSAGLAFTNTRQWASPFSDVNGWAAVHRYSTIRFPDVNGDGRADVCGRGSDGVYCATSDGTAFGGFARWTAELNDGGGWTAEPYYGTISFPDVNGDHRADLCARGPGGVVCGISDGTSFNNVQLWSSDYFSDAKGFNQPQYYKTISFPDLDGDGRADLCGRGAEGMYCESSTSSGAGFVTRPRYSTHPTDAASWNLPQYNLTLSFANVDSSDTNLELCGRGPSGIVCER